MLQWGTPSDVAEYMQWSNYNRNILKGQKKVDISNCVTVIPMAGQGSRFSKEGYDIPKPFIPINGFPISKSVARTNFESVLHTSTGKHHFFMFF